MMRNLAPGRRFVQGSPGQTGLRLTVVRVGRLMPRTSRIITDESRRSTVSSQVTGVGVSSEGEFGANEWLVEELYEQFKVDKNSVDKAWWPILEAYHPADGAAPTQAAAAAPP